MVSGRGRPSQVMLAAGVIALSLLAGCMSGSKVPDATAPPSLTSAPASTNDPSATPAPSTEPGSPTGTPELPLPNPAPSSIPKVTRPGSTDAPTVGAAEVPFASPATYPDGVVVSVTKASKAVESGNGPGVFPGRELLVVDVEVKNGSGQPITLNQVVLTTYYGPNRQTAALVYPPNLDVRDFSGVAAPGGSASARYAFAVPASELRLVTMIVDFDARHASAIFSGSVS